MIGIEPMCIPPPRCNLAKTEESIPRWEAPSQPFVSLYDTVKQFNSHKLFLVAQSLEEAICIFTYNQRMGHQQVHDVNKSIALEHLDNALELINDLPLNVSAKQVERIKTVLSWPDCMYDHLASLMLALQGTIRDELDGVMFMHFNSNEVRLYQDLTPFGSEVAAKFPATVFDAEEAAKCLATARYTACVFHLMRVTELAVQQLGKKLKVTLVGEKNWQAILNEVNKAVRGMATKTAKQKAVRDSYSAASAHLENVKNAWRNPVMHPKETYTENEAEEIFTHVRTLMQHLVKVL